MEVNTFLAIKDRLNYNDTVDGQRKYVPLIGKAGTIYIHSAIDFKGGNYGQENGCK